MNDFKSCSFENITKSCIFNSNLFFLIVLRCWSPVELIQNLIVSFLTFLMKWIIKLNKTVQNPEPAIVRSSRRKVFLQNFAKFTGIHLCRSLFFNKVARELWQNFMNNIFIDQLWTTASENEKLSFVQNL